MSDPRIYFPSHPILPVENSSLNSRRTNAGSAVNKGASFASLLKESSNKVMFSNHAIQRLNDRNLNFSEEDLAKLDDTVARMAEKGAKESVIYMNDTALVVSVANRTVITAMDGSSAKENIFTNIDSAAIL